MVSAKQIQVEIRLLGSLLWAFRNSVLTYHHYVRLQAESQVSPDFHTFVSRHRFLFHNYEDQ